MFLTPDHELDLILLQQWLLRCDVTILPPSLEEMSFLIDPKRLIVRKKCKYLTKWQMLLLFLVGGKSFKLEGSPKQDWKVTKITLWAKWTVAMWADVKLIMWNCYPGRRGRESPVISHCCQLQNKATVVTTHFSLILNTYKLYAAWHNFMNIHFISILHPPSLTHRERPGSGPGWGPGRWPRRPGWGGHPCRCDRTAGWCASWGGLCPGGAPARSLRPGPGMWPGPWGSVTGRSVGGGTRRHRSSPPSPEETGGVRTSCVNVFMMTLLFCWVLLEN